MMKNNFVFFNFWRWESTFRIRGGNRVYVRLRSARQGILLIIGYGHAMPSAFSCFPWLATPWLCFYDFGYPQCQFDFLCTYAFYNSMYVRKMLHCVFSLISFNDKLILPPGRSVCPGLPLRVDNKVPTEIQPSCALLLLSISDILHFQNQGWRERTAVSQLNWTSSITNMGSTQGDS